MKSYAIRQCNMDGSNDTILIVEDEIVQSLTLDLKTKRLYFIKNSRKIFFFDLARNESKLVNTFYGDKRTNARFLDMNITSLEVFGDSIYFSDIVSSSILKCENVNCQEPQEYRKNTSNVKQLKIFAAFDVSTNLETNGCMLKDGKKCEHLCIPKGLSDYVCKCAIGYRTDKRDPNKCIGFDHFLVYYLGHEIKGLSLNGSITGELFTPLQKIDVVSSIDFDTNNDLIYYSDHEKGEIMRIKKDGSRREAILTSTENYEQNNGDWLGGIALDWIAQNIYWTDQKRGLIEVSRTNGAFRRVVSSQLSKPSLIAVDPLLGVLFFINGDFKIIRQNLDGTSNFYVTKFNGSMINNFVLDTNNQAIYLCETRNNKIWKIDYDGNGMKEIPIKNLNNPVSVDILGNTLYWAQKGNYSIKSVKLESMKEFKTLKTSISHELKGIKIFSTKKQHGGNLCATDNGGCEELCLFNGTHGNCFCSHGRPDPKDHKKCKNYENFLYYSRREAIEKLYVDANETTTSNFNIQNSNFLQHAVALAYDYDRKLIFYSELRLGTIFSVDFNGKNFSKLIENQHSVEGMSFDPIERRLFWTLNIEAEIRSIDLSLLNNGTQTKKDIAQSIKTIVKQKKGEDKLRAIAIEPCMNVIFYSNWNNKAPSISKIYVTGFARQEIITKDIFMPNALALDINDKKLFWADARFDKIERCNYDGMQCVILAQLSPKHPFSMIVFEDYIIWTDWMLHGVLRANKYSGNDVTFLRQDVEKPMGIIVVQDTIKNCTNNICANLNGGCEDICLPHGNGVKCECVHGYLDTDGKRCLKRKKSSFCNSTTEFECGSGECIPYILTCDKISHCSDNSDELINFCGMRHCPEESFFQCRNFRCIYKNATCDGIIDCDDGFDEQNCSCPMDQFKCGSGECIKKEHRKCVKIFNLAQSYKYFLPKVATMTRTVSIFLMKSIVRRETAAKQT